MNHSRKPEHAVKISRIRPKSVLNRSGMGGFTLNPYVGCPVGCAYCVEGNTLIMMADGTTKPIEDVLIGEEIVGVSRQASNGGVRSYRCTKATILNKIETLKEAFEIVLENDNRVICSGDHRWLTDRGWKYTKREDRRPYLAANDFIRGIGRARKTPPETEEYKKGFLAGMIRVFDAEGSFSRVVRISNTDEQMLNPGEASNIRLRGGLSEVTRFFQLTAPAISRKCDLTKITLNELTRVVEIRALGKVLPMFDITTSTENFIANGLVSHNCYVPHMAHKQMEQRQWGTYVDVKEGAAELLEQRLSSMRKPARIFMSTATDPYQPAEERFGITRSMLEVFERHPEHSLFILTKQPLVERDADILSRLPRVGVGMSISSIDDGVARLIEPWAPVTSERLAVIKRLSANGIATYVLWAPTLIPSPLTDSFIAEATDAIARSGTRALSLDALNYISRQPAGFLRRLAREGHAPATPDQVKRIERAAEERGLARRIEMLESGPVEEMQPLLPF